MKRRIALIAGGVAVAGSAVYRVVRGRRRAQSADPADELRRKLDESRAIVEEREEFESAETPVDRAEPGVDARRRDVHERGRAAIEEMGEEPEKA
jgi:hypothetical protein